MLISQSPAWPALSRLAPRIIDRLEQQQEHSLFGQDRVFSDPLTFTPFAAARPCSARCHFCSETLRHRGQKRLAASLRPTAGYHDRLTAVLAELKGLRLGLSLSGLEATDDPVWLFSALDVLDGFDFTDRVLYSNTNGLEPYVVDRLFTSELDRIEVSRHHFNESLNDAIMRFREGEPARDSSTFERRVRQATARVEVRLVCVVQRSGICTPESAQRYVDWARNLGVRHVVFRELSRLHDEYESSGSTRYIAKNRVPIEAILPPLGGQAGFEPEHITSGYYFWNLTGICNGVRVTFETSDYKVMKAQHESNVIHKLVLHANGSLNADWDPDKAILAPSPHEHSSRS